MKLFYYHCLIFLSGAPAWCDVVGVWHVDAVGVHLVHHLVELHGGAALLLLWWLSAVVAPEEQRCDNGHGQHDQQHDWHGHTNGDPAVIAPLLLLLLFLPELAAAEQDVVGEASGETHT